MTLLVVVVVRGLVLARREVAVQDSIDAHCYCYYYYVYYYMTL